MTDRFVAKWPVRVNDQVQTIGGGEIIHIGCQYADVPDVITVWTVEWRELGTPPRSVQTFGTGHPLPDGAEPLGSTIVAGGTFVWHLFSVPTPASTS